MKEIFLETRLEASPSRIWAEVNRPQLLRYVARPLIMFKPHDPSAVPERWQSRDCVAGLYLFGVLPFGRQVIGLSRPDAQGARQFLLDDGHSPMIRRWTHLISVEPTGDGTLSSDHVEIDAGILTPFIAAFAHWFSGHLQKRWRKLVAVGFSDGEAQDQPKAR